jgi:hypothetical protein
VPHSPSFCFNYIETTHVLFLYPQFLERVASLICSIHIKISSFEIDLKYPHQSIEF